MNGTHLSAEFKDLIERMFAYDANKRPTIDEINQHPWMNVASTKPYEKVRSEISIEVASKRQVAEEAVML